MPPNNVEFDDMMQNHNNDSNLPNTKAECWSPGSTKSESCDSKPYNPHGEQKSRHEKISSPSVRKRTDARGIVAPSRRDKQLMRQISGLFWDDDAKEEEGEIEEGLDLTGTEIKGIIAPSRKQRQLMRQVSGLGLEDPVFGMTLGLDDSIKKEHASFFFEDMDLNDIPSDMRDMVSLASDRTDVVETDDGHSIDSKSFASLPPLGLNEDKPALSLTKKKLRKGKKPRRKSNLSVISDPMYVPPAAVFETKTKRRGSNHAESIASGDKSRAVDQALAAQVNAILSMNDSKTGMGFSSHSRTSHSGHNRRGTRPTRPKPTRQDSRFSVGSFVPPTLHGDGQSQRGERHLPESMDDIFASGRKKSIKRGKKKKPTEEKKKKKKSSKGKPLRTKSTVSKDADWSVS